MPLTPLTDQLSPLKRETLFQALWGDFDLMTKLLSDWESDAEFLMKHQVPGIKRMPKPSLQPKLTQIVDDANNTIDLTMPKKRFLPQTYLASTVLLALLPPEQIVALPKGLRDLSHMYPDSLISKIPLDIDRYNSEILYQLHPEVAFVAHYSHPATIEALKSQGIPLFFIRNVDTLSDVLDAIVKIGYVADRSAEAALMAAFMEGAMNAIDNRLRALARSQPKPFSTQKVLFLHYLGQFSLPTTKNFTGQLLKRLNEQTSLFAIRIEESDSEWRIPVSWETIVQHHPDSIIISGTNEEEVRKRLVGEHIAYVDEMVQQSLTQHIVLAYYDLFHALSFLFVCA